jgi:hypothetical protein
MTMAEKKRVMICQPMNGLTNFEIRETRLAAIAKLEKEGYEVVNSFFTEEWLDLNAGGIKNKELWCLAKSLEILSSCDTVYFCKDWFKARGCRIEYEAAISYGLEIYEEAVATIRGAEYLADNRDNLLDFIYFNLARDKEKMVRKYKLQNQDK